MKNKIYGILGGLALLGTLGCNGCREEPKTAYAAGDLNKDGVADIIVEAPAFGYYHNRIPLYGVEKDGSVIYVSADEIKKLYPESIIDYNRIEEMLNK